MDLIMYKKKREKRIHDINLMYINDISDDSGLIKLC